jgi:hypothetical protein
MENNPEAILRLGVGIIYQISRIVDPFNLWQEHQLSYIIDDRFISNQLFECCRAELRYPGVHMVFTIDHLDSREDIGFHLLLNHQNLIKLEVIWTSVGGLHESNW